MLLDVSLSYVYCLIFGALIAPTDPVAVISILKSVKASKSIETKIAGESLFNDGIGIVVFLILVGIATGGESASVGSALMLFLQEAVGGVGFGFIIGWIAYQLLKNVDDYSVEILITLALVSGGYALALAVHTSGPIAIVVAGLMIGNHGRLYAMTDVTRDNLDTFWELIDEILNAVLFAWIGLEILVLAFSWDYLLAGLIAIPLSLAARFISVSSFVGLLKFRRKFSENAIKILTWGGLRGGISIALALSLASSESRDMIVAITYVVVIFSIFVQGSTIKYLVKPE
jgi:CPA1 family monovalent cation:H+ antiporter